MTSRWAGGGARTVVVKSARDRPQKNSAADGVCQLDRISVTVSLSLPDEYEKSHPAGSRDDRPRPCRRRRHRGF